MVQSVHSVQSVSVGTKSKMVCKRSKCASISICVPHFGGSVNIYAKEVFCFYFILFCASNMTPQGEAIIIGSLFSNEEQPKISSWHI